jgi:C4-type Zn-finger protein
MSRMGEYAAGVEDKAEPDEDDCPVCGGRGYTVEKYGDDIEYNGCIICYCNNKERMSNDTRELRG